MLIVAVAVLAPWLAPHSPVAQNLRDVAKPPTDAHPLGTDQLGRDLLSRVIYGARTSLVIGGVVLAIAFGVGTAVGFAAGWFGCWVDEGLMRAIDVLMAFPEILLAIAVVAALGPGLVNTMLAVGVSATPRFARLARAIVLSLRDQMYVEAARASGATEWRVLRRYILPNSMAVLLVQATLVIAIAIQAAAGLGFLGLGAQPPTAEWGVMLSDSRTYISTAPWLLTAPGLALMVTVMAFNFLGDGLQDVLAVQIAS